MKIKLFLIIFSLLIVACQPAVNETLQPATEIVPTFTPSPVPSITPSPTEEPLTIGKLALIPIAERKQMMLEATGIDFMTSDETPHLGFEIVHGEDGTYTIDRVYNILTGEMVELSQRADNVTPDTFTYVEQDWQSLDQEAVGQVQVFPRVDGKGVIVLKLPPKYSVFSDDPTTPEKEYVTTNAPEGVVNIELPTVASFDDAMEYAIFVKGARYKNYEVTQLLQNPEIYHASYPRNFYGGGVIIGANISTPDGRITFSMGVRSLPSGDLVVSFSDINGIFNEVIIDMKDGLDGNGYSAWDIVDIVKTASGDSGMMSRRDNPDAKNTLPAIPEDFDY